MTADMRPLVIAYNDFAIAAQDDAYQIGQYQLTKTTERLTLACEFVVIGSSATDLASKVSALDTLRGAKGTLVIQQARELTLPDVVGNGTTTVTSATGGFTSSHIGDWLVIRTVGARRITAVASSTSITVHASLANGTYDAIKPARMFRGTHSGSTFMRAEPTLTKKSGSSANTELSQHYSLSVVGAITDPDEDDDDPEMDTLSVTFRKDASNRRSLSLSGTFRSSTTSSARSLYTAQIESLCSTHAASFGGLSIYERTLDEQSYDSNEAASIDADEQVGYSFRREYVERFESDHDAIISQTMTVSMGGGQSNGIGGVGRVSCSVTYRCNVDHEKMARGGLYGLYTGTIRNLISTAIAAYTGCGRDQQAVTREEPSFEQGGNVINATWSVLLLGRCGTVLSVSDPVSEANDTGQEVADVWDGKPHTYARWKNKPSRTRTYMRVVESLVPFEFKSEGLILKGDHPFKSTVEGGEGEEDAEKTNKIDVEWADGGSEMGKWIQRGVETVKSTIETVGVSTFGEFALAKIYTATLTRTDLYFLEAEAIEPKFVDLQITGLDSEIS